MFSKSDKTRDSFMLHGRLARRGYDWWWHSFTGVNSETGVEKSFFIEFFICNPELGGDRPVFGQTKEKNKPSYLMIKVGTWGEDAKQIHRFFGINNINIRAYPFQVRADDCYLDDYKTYGSVKCINSNKHPEYMCVDGEFSWNLKINKIIPFNVGYGASSFFRRLNLFEMFWHAEGMKSTYDGEVILDGLNIYFNTVVENDFMDNEDILSFDEIPYGMNHIDRLMAYYKLGGRSNQHKEDVFFTVSDLKSTFSRNRAYKNIKDVGKFLNSLYEKDYLGKLEGKYNGKNIYYLTSKCEEIDYVLEVTDEHREKRDKIIDETFSV